MKPLTEQQIQDGWQMVKFGEIAKNISVRVEPSETDLDIYVGLEHLDPQSLRITRYGTPADVIGQKLLVRPGQIIFGKRRAYQKKVAIADFDGICSAHAMVLEAIPGKIVPALLPFLMQSDMFMDRAVAISEGSLSPTIKWKTLAIQEFPLPPLARQKEILDVLEKVEEVTIKYDGLITHSESLLNVLMQDLISGSNNFPKREIVSLSEIVSIKTSPVDKKSKKDEISVFLCNYLDVYNNREINNKIDFMVATASESEIEKFTLFKGDVVITKDSETPDDIAVPAYVGETIEKLVCGYHLSILRPQTKLVDGKYLLYALSTKKTRYDFIPFAQGMTRYGLSSDAYNRVKIYCPEINKQLVIINVLDAIQKELDILKIQANKFYKKRQLIIKELLFGIKKNRGETYVL